MISWLSKYGVGMRALVYLRAISLSSMRIADALESLASNDASRWQHELKIKPKPRPTVVTTLDVAEAEAKWERIKRAEAEGLDLGDE
jgi:hypothetical protein